MTTEDSEEGLTYSEAGVDIADSEAATAALVAATGDFEGDFAGLIDLGDRHLALATDGVGTKLLVAEAVDDHSTIGIDCIAMNVNDLLAQGIDPVAFVDYLALEDPDDALTAEIGEGLQTGAEQAGVALVGGETAVLPEVIRGYDLAGACVGLAPEGTLFPGAAEPGDRIVAWPSSGVHSNGLTLAREALTGPGGYAYDDPAPFDSDRTIGEVLLEPTRIYADLLVPLRGADTHAAAHVTGGGWRNLLRMGDHRYEVDDPFDAQPIYDVIQDAGAVSDAEMHRTFNMGTGFVAAVAPDEADGLAADTGGRVIGRVEAGEPAVAVRGLELTEA